MATAPMRWPCSGRRCCLAGWMKLKAMALGDRLNRRRIGLGAEAGDVTEKLFDSRGGRRPRDVQQPRSCIAQSMPCLPRDIEHHPRQDSHGLPFQRRPSLPLVDEQHLILGEVSVDGNCRTGKDRFGPRGKRGVAPPGIDINDNFPRRGRP